MDRHAQGLTIFRLLTILGIMAVLCLATATPALSATSADQHAITGIGSYADSASGQAHPSGACNRPYPPGQHTMTLISGGLDRTVVLYVPSGYNGRHRLPLVLDLHGSQSNAVEQLERSEMAAAAERHTFVVAAPQGYIPAPPGFRWNVPGVTLPPGTPPDDEMFLSDTIDWLQARLCIASSQVYGTGYSGGGRMISQYACDHADRLVAIGPVVGLRAGVPISGPNGPEPDPATCNPSHPVPIITFAGTADPVNPYLGGGAPYWQYGTPAAQARWAALNRCHHGPRTRQVTEHVSLVTYFACRSNAQVLLYVVEGGGHTWPGSEALIPLEPFLGPVTFEIDATELMWRFFDRHRRPGPRD